MIANNNNSYLKVSKNKHRTDEDNYKQTHSQININPRNNKTEKHKKLNRTEPKTDMNMIEKLSNTSMTEHKTDKSITKRLSSTFTKEH